MVVRPVAAAAESWRGRLCGGKATGMGTQVWISCICNQMCTMPTWTSGFSDTTQVCHTATIQPPYSQCSGEALVGQATYPTTNARVAQPAQSTESLLDIPPTLKQHGQRPSVNDNGCRIVFVVFVVFVMTVLEGVLEGVLSRNHRGTTHGTRHGYQTFKHSSF